MFVEDKSKFIGVEAWPDPFTLEALIAWLRTHPIDEEYDYSDWHTCLLGVYTIASGGRHFWEEGAAVDWISSRARYGIGSNILPACGSNLAIEVARPRPHTMGAALARAETLLA